MAAMGADDPNPYVFYILNQRNDLKPLGWNIVNPLAPATVTPSILNRWAARTGVSAYTLYQHITPDMAPYWEVSLSGQTNLDALLQFDVLLLNLHNHTVSLTSAEAEMLRRFVDGGGQLWVENSGGGEVVDPLFLDFQFNNGAASGAALLPVALNTPTLQRHPIIDAPYQLQQKELNSLGVDPVQATITGFTSLTALPDPTLLSTVVGNGSANNSPIISAGQMGAGQIVVTTPGSSAAINDAVGGTTTGFGPNSGPFCGKNYGAAPTADLKFVTDLLSWDTAHPNELKTSHQSSQSRSSLGPALTPTWFYPLAGSVGGTAPGAAINGDFVFVRAVDGLLHAFNALPDTDILESQAAVPDAGLLDYIYGKTYDEIWNSSAAGTFPGVSSPLTVPASAALSAPTIGHPERADVGVHGGRGRHGLRRRRHHRDRLRRRQRHGRQAAQFQVHRGTPYSTVRALRRRFTAGASTPGSPTAPCTSTTSTPAAPPTPASATSSPPAPPSRSSPRPPSASSATWSTARRWMTSSPPFPPTWASTPSCSARGTMSCSTTAPP